LKIVREHINEKFVEDSDPVTDMGIGIRAQISNWMKENKWNSVNDDVCLTQCAYYGKLDWVKFLILDGADVNFQESCALRWASDAGHLEIVKELLRAGANVHAKYEGSEAQTALKAAKNKKHYNIVNFLEDYIANEKKSKRKAVKESLLEKFVEDSDPVTDMGIGTRAQISRWMKERGEEDTDENALAECAEHGKLEWVKFLIAAGANVHYVDDYALRLASQNGHLKIVKELLKAGAGVDAWDNYSIEKASQNGHIDVVKELLKHNAKMTKEIYMHLKNTVVGPNHLRILNLLNKHFNFES
jgi:ankyrin repeat protein